MTHERRDVVVYLSSAGDDSDAPSRTASGRINVDGEQWQRCRDRVMSAASSEPNLFRFQIKQDRDGKYRWYVFNANGTLPGNHPEGFPDESEAGVMRSTIDISSRWRRSLAQSASDGTKKQRAAR